jgi:molecular chaperone DnaK
LDKDDTDAMKQSLEKLTALSHKAAEELYKATAQQQPHPPSGGNGADGDEKKAASKEDEPIEAEFREEKRPQ